MRKFAIVVLAVVLVAPGAYSQTSRTLEDTPRHDEWVRVERGERVVHTYVVYPEASEKVMAVMLIHENRGLTDWVRALADELASQGFVVLAPDLLSGMGPDGGRTSDFESSDSARQAIYKLEQSEVVEDLRAVVEYARAIPSVNGSVAVGGFCWGGSRTWDVANNVSGLAGSFVFYGTGPKDQAGVANIDAPVWGFYGGNDARVNATIPLTKELMDAGGRKFESRTWDGAGHAFMRRGAAEDADPANRRAADEAGERWLELLKEVSDE
jgi:carboxymethylenebutenolidase